MAPPGRLLAAVALVSLIGTGCANAPVATGSGGGATAADQNPAAEATPNPEPKEERSELARCMRENGVEDFPDPDDAGIIQYYGEDPEFPSAQEKCRDISPREEGQEGNGG